jgi:hypothetical protein
MGSLVFQATLGGQVNLNGPNTASTFDIAVPATTGTMVTTGDSGTVTNTMLAASAYNTPGTIGSGTANTGAFTTLSASSTVSGTGFSTYLASPPAIGGTAAAAGTFTTLSGTTSVTTPIVKSASSLTLQINGSTTAVTVNTSGNVGIGTTSPSQKFVVSNAGADNIIMAENTTASIQLYMQSNTVNGVIGTLTNHTLALYTNNTERMRIDTSGNLLVGTIGLDGKFRVEQTGVSWARATNHTNAGTQYFDSFRYNGTPIGSITGNDTSVIYSTTSDHRLKENVTPMTGALAKISALKPVTYKWKLNGSDGEGFIAHELAEVCPQAVIGAKDAVDADGNPIHQGIDTSFLVATLTAAIQEQQALITSLTARIAALEAK